METRGYRGRRTLVDGGICGVTSTEVLAPSDDGHDKRAGEGYGENRRKKMEKTRMKMK